MLPSPGYQEALDRIIAETRKALKEYYRANGMNTSPFDVNIHVPAAELKAYSTSKAAEMSKQLIPPGVNFTDKPRVSGALRERYLNHLRELCGQEYVDVPEMSARMDAMMIANTEDELAFLIHDLPALPEAKEEVEKQPSFIGTQRETAIRCAICSMVSFALYIGIPVTSTAGSLVHVLFGFMTIALSLAGLSSWNPGRKNKKKE
jgi:hypothetical protein